MSNPEVVPSPGEMMDALAKGLAAIAETMQPLREAVEGYRAQMERDGYGDALARKMAADYHAALLRVVLK